MGKRNGIFALPVGFLLVVCLSTNLFSAQIDAAIHSLKPTIQQPEINHPASVESSPSNLQSAICNPKLVLDFDRGSEIGQDGICPENKETPDTLYSQ